MDIPIVLLLIVYPFLGHRARVAKVDRENRLLNSDAMKWVPGALAIGSTGVPQIVRNEYVHAQSG